MLLKLSKFLRRRACLGLAAAVAISAECSLPALAQSPAGSQITALPAVGNDTGATAIGTMIEGKAQPVGFQGDAPATDLESRLDDLQRTIEWQQAQMNALQDKVRAQQSEVSQTQTSQLGQQLTAPTPAPPKPYVVGSVLSMQPIWNNGLEFRSPNRDFYFHVGGRTQLDSVWLSSPAPANALVNTSANSAGLQDAVVFRRARLRMEGSMYELVDWCVEYNFVNAFDANSAASGAPQVGPGGTQDPNGANITTLQNRTFNTVQPVDLWWNVREVPFFGNIQFGNQKEVFGLERLESSRYLDFLERNYGNDAFISPAANGFAPGIAAWNWTRNRRMTYAAGVYKNVTNGFAWNVGDGQGEWAARVTTLPWYDEPTGGRYFMHVGCGVCQRAIDNDLIRYRSRNDLRNGPDSIITAFSDTNFIGGQYQEILNPEFMLQYGPLFVQAEYVGNWTTNAIIFPAGTGAGGAPPVGIPGSVPGSTNIGSLYYWSSYCQVMYFLTGEHRIYDYQKGLVGRVIPRSNAFWVRRGGRGGPFCFGPGAWQVGYRINYLDTNQKGVDGGTLLGHTIGVNWFWNPNSKLQFNFDVMDRRARSSTANTGIDSAGTGTTGFIYGFGTRFAADF